MLRANYQPVLVAMDAAPIAVGGQPLYTAIAVYNEVARFQAKLVLGLAAANVKIRGSRCLPVRA